MRFAIPSRRWYLAGLLSLIACGGGEPTDPGDPPGGAKPTLPGVPSILAPIAGKFRTTGKENPTCVGQAGFWTFCQHESDLHAEGKGIQASDDTYAWDMNRVGPNGEPNADLGQTVFSVEQGRVVKYGGSVSAGTDECKSVLIEHTTNGTTWWSGYLHMSEVLVADGQSVTASTPIGKVGHSCVTNDHLHFVAYTGANTSRGLLSRDVGFVERVIAIPAAPADLAATAVSSAQISLTWTRNSSNEEGFRIERCTGSGCSDFSEIATAPASATGYDDGGLSGSTTYRYRVRAFNTTGSSAYSSPASATTPVLIVPPAPPTNLGATAPSFSLVTLSWTDNAANEDGYRIERCSGSACTDFSEIGTTPANATSYQNTGLSATTAYRYRVRGYNSAGNSAYSNVLAITTPVAPPAGATSLAATGVSASQIDLSWMDNAATEDGYKIERCSGATCTSFAEIATTTANATTYQSTGLAAATAYRYRVIAYNIAGTSPVSNVATASTLPTAPANPSNFAATAQSPSRIDLSWTDNASNEDNYKVERCTGAACADFSEIATLPANSTSYQNTGLAELTTYQYRVRAVNTGGNSAYSSVASASTPSAIPPAPTTLAATPQSPSRIDLSWTDNAGNEDGFRVERCVGAGCSDFAEIASLAANVVAFQSTGLTANTTYMFRVRASNSFGFSGYSNVITAATPTIPPSVTTAAATNVTETGFQMNGTVNPNGFATSAFFEWSVNDSFNPLVSAAPLSVGSGNVAVPVSSVVTSNLCGLTFYFRTVGVNSAAVESRGPTLSTTLSACTIPNTPVATGPGSTTGPGPTIASDTATFSWSVVSNAYYYRIGVADVQSGTVLVDQNLQSNSLNVVLAPGRAYSWSVTACNPAGCNPTFTTPLYFRTP